MSQLMVYNKRFLIVGNINNITYKEITPLFKTGDIWTGHEYGHFWFTVPDSYEEKVTDFKIDENGQKWRHMGNICWFTNLEINKRHEDITHYSSITFLRLRSLINVLLLIPVSSETCL